MKNSLRITLLALLILALGCACVANAMIIPPQGEGQIGVSALVVNDGLAVYDSPDTNSNVAKNLDTGKLVIVVAQEGDWAEIVMGDSEDEDEGGWVKAEGLMIDISFYLTEAETDVYAWNDVNAPKLYVLDAYSLLPIIKDDGEWVIVMINGGTAWIQKTELDLNPNVEE